MKLLNRLRDEFSSQLSHSAESKKMKKPSKAALALLPKASQVIAPTLKISLR